VYALGYGVVLPIPGKGGSAVNDAVRVSSEADRCDNLVFFGLILVILTYLYIHYFVAYISMFPFHQYQSEV
jgi:hypothetical protein